MWSYDVSVGAQFSVAIFQQDAFSVDLIESSERFLLNLHRCGFGYSYDAYRTMGLGGCLGAFLFWKWPALVVPDCTFASLINRFPSPSL